MKLPQDSPTIIVKRFINRRNRVYLKGAETVAELPASAIDNTITGCPAFGYVVKYKTPTLSINLHSTNSSSGFMLPSLSSTWTPSVA